MYTTKKTTLLKPKAKKVSSKTLGTASAANAFLNQGIKNTLEKTLETRSGNGAKKYSSTGDVCVDQFGKTGSYKAPRDFATVGKDFDAIWSEDPLTAVKFNLYLRTIPRKVTLFDGSVTENPQKGGELKNESIMRMLWLHQKDPDTFWKNIGLFISLGSWHDVFKMLQTDLIHHGWDKRVLNWNKFGNLILTALENSNTSELVKKYLPQIKAISSCKTVDSQANCMIAKWICSLLFGKKESPATYKAYRKLKSAGTAHEWQKLISQKQFDRIKFEEIHGRALNLLVRSKFLKNQGLSEKFTAWVKKPTTVAVKYTGFVYELFEELIQTGYSYTRGTRYKTNIEEHVKATINKQFDTLVQKAKGEKEETHTNFIVVRDTSASMSSPATGARVSCFDVAKSLALYFSEFLTGTFAGSFIEFNSNAKMHKWKGATPVDKFLNDKCDFVGSTNFQSVIELFATLKKQGVPEKDFPTGILCISDSEFNPATLGKTNVQAARTALKNAGFSRDFYENFQIVLWNLQSSYYGAGTGTKFETVGNEKGVYYFSGLSASVITFLTNSKVETARDIFDAAMNQEVLSRVTL